MLLYADKMTKEMEIVLHFDEYEKWHKNLHSKMELYKDKIFFFPCSSKRIYIYDINTKEQKYISLDEICRVDDVYYEPFRMGNTMWMISRKPGLSVIRYEMETEEIFYEKEVSDAIKGITVSDEERTYLGEAIKGDYIYIGIRSTNCILELDTLNGTVRRIELDKSIRLRNIFIDDECLWCVELEGTAIYKYNFETEKTESYNYSNSDGNEVLFTKIIITNNEKYVINIKDLCLYKVDENRKKVIRIDSKVIDETERISADRYINLCAHDSNAVTYALNSDTTIYRYILCNGTYEKKYLKSENIQSYLNNITCEKINYMYNENQIMSEEKDAILLESFIESKQGTQKDCVLDKLCGELVFDKIIEENQ